MVDTTSPVTQLDFSLQQFYYCACTSAQYCTAWKGSKDGVISGPYSVRILENTDRK